MFAPKGRAGLLWVGEAFYPTPDDFSTEAARQGISRRIHQIPREFKLGETWVLFAHRKTIDRPTLEDPKAKWPGIFHTFKPTEIQYVVKGTESEDELEAMAKRGITPVRVVKDGELDFHKPVTTDED